MTTLRLGNKSDVFSTAWDNSAAWMGAVVYGENGNDMISIGYAPQPGSYPYPSRVDNATAHGGNGNDTLSALGHDDVLFGDGGADLLTVIGTGNTANGGAGADHLIATTVRYSQSRYTVVDAATDNHLNGNAGNDILESHSTQKSFSSYFRTNLGEAGTVMTGGDGTDAFILRNSSDLIVTNDANGVVSENDILLGVIDAITDYRPGERVDINAPAAITAVPLSTGPQHRPLYSGSGDPLLDTHKHLLLADGAHASFRGNLTGPGQFTVSQTGLDLLVAYDTADGIDSLLACGAAVLRGVTAESQVLFA